MATTEVDITRTTPPLPPRPIPHGGDTKTPYDNIHTSTNVAPNDSQRYRDSTTPTAQAGRRSPASSIDADAHLPTILFVIPFPPAARPSSSPSHKLPASPYLIYALPRAPYHKPAEDEEGHKLEKEGLVKKVERKWQEEVAEGEKIREGQDPEAGKWKKFKGKAVGIADTVIHWLPNSRMEAIGRVPPKRKLGELTVLYPDNVPGPSGQPLTPKEVQERLEQVLKETQKAATVNAIGSACLLPVTLAIDFFVVVPIFLFEMNLAYFSTQVSGRSKVGAITSSPTALIASPSHILAPVSYLLHETCHDASPRYFSHPGGSASGGKVMSKSKGVDEATVLAAADALITAFVENTTPQVQERHILDREKVAEDLKRCCAKASKEYVKRVV